MCFFLNRFAQEVLTFCSGSFGKAVFTFIRNALLALVSAARRLHCAVEMQQQTALLSVRNTSLRGRNIAY